MPRVRTTGTTLRPKMDIGSMRMPERKLERETKKVVVPPMFIETAWVPEFVQISKPSDDGNFDKVGGKPSLYPVDTKDDDIFSCHACTKSTVFLGQLTDPDYGLTYQIFWCANVVCKLGSDEPFFTRFINYDKTTVAHDVYTPPASCYDHKTGPASVEDRKAFRVTKWKPRPSLIDPDIFRHRLKSSERNFLDRAFRHGDDDVPDPEADDQDDTEDKDDADDKDDAANYGAAIAAAADAAAAAAVVDEAGEVVILQGMPIQFGGQGLWAQNGADDLSFRLHLYDSHELPLNYGDLGTAHFSPSVKFGGDSH